MKKILSLLKTITLIGISTTSLVACNTPQYTKKELADLKKNNIKTKDGILEWIAPQEKPFDTADNKYYFIVWKKDEWEIINILKNYPIEVGKEYFIYKDSKYELKFFKGITSTNKIQDTSLFYSSNNPFVFRKWGEKNSNYINYIKSVYRWESINIPSNIPKINLKTGQITDWNLKQQNNINNDHDHEIQITVKNKDISENPIYELEKNYFNWLSITNELETNNIPSLIPAEIKLTDGEYGKYLTNLIVANDKIENYLNYFSQWYKLLYSKAVWMNMTKDLVEDSIKITFDKKLFNLNQIKISGIWGSGNYDITIFTEKEQININNLKLFNKNNEKLSLINLEI